MNRIFTLIVLFGCLGFHPLVAQNGFKENSVFATGIIHEVAVSRSGVYKIDYNFIKNEMKIDPASVSPSQTAVFSNRGGRIPQWSGASRIDDFEQIPSSGKGLEDGQFNPGDYLMFYAEGPDRWRFDSVQHVYVMEKNIYDELNHYFIVINGPSRIELTTRENNGSGNYVSDRSMFFQQLEEEKVNLLGRYRPPGSGQAWFGDELAVLDKLNYTSKFDFTDFSSEDTLQFTTRFAARSGPSSRFYIYFDEKEFSKNVGGLGNNLGNFEASYAVASSFSNTFVPGAPISKIEIRYPTANGVDAQAWIDFIRINSWKFNIYHTGNQLYLRDPRLRFKGTPQYSISQFPASGLIWEITNPMLPVNQQFDAGANLFSVANPSPNQPNEFVCFNPETDLLVPAYEGQVANQNLHALKRTDLLIVYYDDFEDAALALAQHRRDHDQLLVETIPASKVFLEFGGGSKDPSALRDFARMLYKRDPQFKYLLLMGDATYDFLHHSADLPFQNFIPAFETEESLDPIRSFPSDDFFALLDNDEGDNLVGALDIAVGRFPVSTAEEAMEIVDKIIYYDTNPLTLDDWRNRIVIVADDEDSNIHMTQADLLAVKSNLTHPVYNEQKIYLDAYPQQSTPGGDRYPAVNDAIDLNMQKGALTVTYLGHGGPNGWTQERVLGINQAQSYDNLENMPLFITATCSFAGYDEPGFTSTGEHLLINPNGGAIALMTTVRAVYSGSNSRLTDAVHEILFVPDQDGNYLRIGEVLRRSKNANGIDTVDTNARKFTLLGDPSLKLAFPKYNVVVTELQHHPIGTSTDTLSALGSAVVSGVIEDHHGNVLTSFNGSITLTLFDKPQVRQTLANDEGSSVRNFTTQTRQLFKGTASVNAGIWTIEFVLPKDIDFSYGNGKMSFYAEDGAVDANGYFTGFLVGGVSDGGIVDDQPPVIRLFMNDNNFLSGGITDTEPDIYAELSDDYGINVSGTSVGHDIEATLDGDDKNSFILNDFYQAALNDPTRGTVKYPLSDLAPGRHTLSLRAWDISNNAAEATIEFVVIDDNAPVITHSYNYPNPFSTVTYFAFEHNRPGTAMDIRVDIYSIQGQLVRSILQPGYLAGGYRVDDISWNGANENGSELGAGIYVYKIKATISGNNQSEVVESEPGKLVIVR